MAFIKKSINFVFFSPKSVWRDRNKNKIKFFKLSNATPSGHFQNQTNNLCLLPTDECRNNPCGPKARCLNEPGSYKCQCPKGTRGDPYTTGCVGSSRTECNEDEDCPGQLACEGNVCVNPCRQGNFLRLRILMNLFSRQGG